MTDVLVMRGDKQRRKERDGGERRGVFFSFVRYDCADSQRTFSASSFVFEEPSFDQFSMLLKHAPPLTSHTQPSGGH